MKTTLPYLPEGRRQLEVPSTNTFMARALAELAAMEAKHPEANRAACSVLVKDGAVIGVGCNGSVHKTFCPRKALAIPTGQGYEFCPDFCHPINHSEPTAIADARAKGHDTAGADLYMAGHWWACQPCWKAMIGAGIRDLYVLTDADERYGEGARKGHGNAGVLRQPLKVYLMGAGADEFAARLARVNIQAVPNPEQSDAVILFLGAVTRPESFRAKQVYDYRNISDYRLAMLQLSRDLP